MDTLHNVMRSISGERKADTRRDHLTVFREFLDHLDRAAKKKVRVKAAGTKTKTRRR
jgi:hypothetical protein